MAASVYDFTVKTDKGALESLAKYKGYVSLIVNVASKCGFTPQYKDLEQLYQMNRTKKFVVLGFPCNQFFGQEPGSDEEIHTFCTSMYGIQFPLFSKINVNGEDADPLFKHLKMIAPGVLGSTGIKWNFTKFLVDRDGQVTERFAPVVSPLSIQSSIYSLLEAGTLSVSASTSSPGGRLDGIMSSGDFNREMLENVVNKKKDVK